MPPPEKETAPVDNPNKFPLWDKGGKDKGTDTLYWHPVHKYAVIGTHGGRQYARACEGKHWTMPYHRISQEHIDVELARVKKYLRVLDGLSTSAWGSPYKLYGEARDLTPAEEQVRKAKRTEAYAHLRGLIKDQELRELYVSQHFGNHYEPCKFKTKDAKTPMCGYCAKRLETQMSFRARANRVFDQAADGTIAVKEADAQFAQLHTQYWAVQTTTNIDMFKVDAVHNAQRTASIDALLRPPIFNPPQRKPGALRDTAPDCAAFVDDGALWKATSAGLSMAPSNPADAAPNTRYIVKGRGGHKYVGVRATTESARQSVAATATSSDAKAPAEAAATSSDAKAPAEAAPIAKSTKKSRIDSSSKTPAKYTYRRACDARASVCGRMGDDYCTDVADRAMWVDGRYFCTKHHRAITYHLNYEADMKVRLEHRKGREAVERGEWDPRCVKGSKQLAAAFKQAWKTELRAYGDDAHDQQMPDSECDLEGRIVYKHYKMLCPKDEPRYKW